MLESNTLLYVIGGIFLVLFLFLAAQILMLRSRLNRLTKKYKYFMNGEDGGSLELRLSTEVRELRDHAAPVVPESGTGSLRCL